MVENNPQIMAILERHGANATGLLFGIDCYDMIGPDMRKGVKVIVGEIEQLGIGTTELRKWLSFVDGIQKS
jgi:hypothetical protein